MGFKTRSILKHTDKHLLKHLLCRGGSNDAADLLQAFEQITWCLLVAQDPQTVRQSIWQVQVVVCFMPEMKKLQNVLPGEARRDHGPDIRLLNFHSWQAVRYLHEVVERQVF